ncbi:MAG: YaiI/YqxD family protein [Pseudomonadota bacterium]
MNIWVDADAVPVAIKELLYRAAQRTGILLTLVANQTFQIPRSPFIKFLLVESGFDVADNQIVKCLKPGDLVITADIPLAALVIDKGGQALNPRGELYTKDTIRSRLYARDVMENLRSIGVETSGPAPMNQKDKHRFVNHLDQILFQARKR